jgi:hypothetical protein
MALTLFNDDFFAPFAPSLRFPFETSLNRDVSTNVRGIPLDVLEVSCFAVEEECACLADLLCQGA